MDLRYRANRLRDQFNAIKKIWLKMALMIAAQARIEVWRTQQANNRNIVHSTR